MILTRLSKTHHESLLSKELPKFGLSTDIPMSYIDTPASWLHWIRMTKWTSYWWKTVLPSTKAFGTSGNVSNQNIPFFRRVMLNFSGVARSISMPMKGHPKKRRASWWFLIRVCWDMAAESASAVLQNLVMLKWILLGIPWQLGTYTVWWLRGCTQWRKTKTALYWNFWIS